jgi:hypothetical protein
VLVAVPLLIVATYFTEEELYGWLAIFGVVLAPPFAVARATRSRRAAVITAAPFLLAALVCFVGAVTFWSDTSGWLPEREVALWSGIIFLIAAPLALVSGLIGASSRAPTTRTGCSSSRASTRVKGAKTPAGGCRRIARGCLGASTRSPGR